MSTDTLVTSNTAAGEEVTPTTTAVNEQTEASSTNGSFHSNGNGQSDEQQVDSSKVAADESEQKIYNKSDLEPEFMRKVFIGGLSYKTDEQAFKAYFSNYGDILDSIIMRDREGRSRGFGFVTYATSAMVDRLMSTRPHNLDSREVEPKRAVPREESGKPESSMTAKKLFVGGIREGAINEQDLSEYFSKYGNIIDAVIMKTNDGKLRGFGFVEFDDYDPVDKIVLEKHHIIKGNTVNVEKALPKEQTNRARQAAGGYGGPMGGRGGGGGGMRGPPSRMGGGWGPMGGDSNYGGGNYRSGGGGYSSGGDYGNRSGSYGGGGYGGDMGGSGGGMMGYGGSGSMGGHGGGGYGMGGPPRGGFDDGFGAFAGPTDYGFGQGYEASPGGGPMRRGGPGRGGAGGAPYGRGGGYHGRS